MLVRRKVHLAALAACAACAGAVQAQETQRVEITGSSIKRIDAETAVPVTVLRRDDIDKSGATNVQELVDRLASNNGGGRSLGESIGETSAPGQSGASIRGLGRDRTLVLLNGRRLPVYPFSGIGVDLNAIPLGAIERIEILRDGASAIYGSDAIGGVINFITRRDLQGGQIEVGYEAPEARGGKAGQAAVAFGFGDLASSRFNVLGSLTFQKYDVVKAADRDFAKTGNRPDLGIVKFSSNTFPANAYATTNGGASYTRYIPGAAGAPGCAPPDSFFFSGACRYDYTSKIDIYPESERIGFLGRANFQANADNLVFLEYLHSDNKIRFGSSQTPSTTTGKPSYFYPAGGQYYPTAAVDATLPGYRGPLRLAWRIVDGGQRTDEVRNKTDRLLFGLDGSAWGWDYKAGIYAAEARAVDTYVDGYFSDTALVSALATGNINPFGPNDATGLALLEGAKIKADIRSSKTTLRGADAVISREIFKLPAGGVSLAVGVEGRRENYSDGYTPIASSGDIVGGSGNQGAVTARRTTAAVYAEMAVPIVKGLDAQLAVRHDRYTNTSGTSRDGTFDSPNTSATSPKVALRYQPIKEVLLRASYGKGFRAPGLDSLYAPYSDTNTGGQFTDPYFNRNGACNNPATADPDFCEAQLTARNYSNPNLKPEKSKQFTLGLVLEPINNLSIGVDYFDIKIENGITFLDADTILKDFYDKQTGPTTSSSVYADRLVVDPATGNLAYVRSSYENVGRARVAGFDVSARYRVRSDFGTFTPGWEATYLTKSTTSNVVSGIESNNLGQYARGGPAVRLKQVVTLDWERGGWGIGGRYFWQSGYTDYDGTSRVGSYEMFDLQGRYSGIKNLTVTLGVRNLFDRKPPVTVQEDYFQVGFDPTYADVKGRTYYLRASYKF